MRLRLYYTRCVHSEIHGDVQMKFDRRKFLGSSAAVGLNCVLGSELFAIKAENDSTGGKYKYRIAFELWLNDVRNEPLTLSNWPAAVLDDKTVEGITRALDVQSAAGYNMLDLCGLWGTYGWPEDFEDVAPDRQKRIHQIIRATHGRNMKVLCFPSGILNWGYDQILKANPGIASDNKHEMNPLVEQSWEWMHRVFDFVANNYDIDGFHLEAADQGRCNTPECLEKWPDDVAFYGAVTKKMADYLRKQHPRLFLFATIQSFAKWGTHLTPEQRGHVVELSKSIDCLVDQGHLGTYIAQNDWPSFISSLHCDFGTSGGLWLYPPQRWDRMRWFLPYTQRTGNSISTLYQAGGRGLLYYQGPTLNPGVEINIDFGGRIMNQPGKNVTAVLSETVDHLYHPRNDVAHRKLVEIIQDAEDAYFGRWDRQRIQDATGRPAPGEFYTSEVLGSSPGSARYLMEPYLDTAGRLHYKQSLISLYQKISSIETDFNDGGRIGRIKQGLAAAMTDVNTISTVKNEKAVWDDSKVGLQL